MEGPEVPDSPEEDVGLPGDGMDGVGMDGEEVGLGIEGVDEGLGEGIDAGDDGPGEPGEPDEGLGGAGVGGLWGWMLGDLHAVNASSKPIPVSLIIVETIFVLRLA